MRNSNSRMKREPFAIDAPAFDFAEVFERPELISQLKSQNKALENLRLALDMDDENPDEVRADRPCVDQAV